MKNKSPLASQQKQTWGFTREDLRNYGVEMLINVEFRWSDKTPVRLRKAFGQASNVLHYIAEKQIFLQLAMDNLKPATKVNVTYGWGQGETTISVRQPKGRGQLPE